MDEPDDGSGEGAAGNRARIRQIFDYQRDWVHEAVAGLGAGSADEILAEAETRFETLLPGLAYRDEPDHSMAGAVVACAALLAIWLTLEPRGVDVHAWGAALMATPLPPPPPDAEAIAEQQRSRFIKDAKRSQEVTRPGEFVYELIPGDGSFDWGMNVKSCAICYLFGQHDAMDLVPYMCAIDDLTSDQGSAGLRRTGTIALGAHRCDFRYQQGGEPAHLAAAYPEQIRIIDGN